MAILQNQRRRPYHRGIIQYQGKAAAAQQKPRDARGHFVSQEELQQQAVLAQQQKFGMLLGSGGNQRLPQQQMQRSPEDHINDMIGFRKNNNKR